MVHRNFWTNDAYPPYIKLAKALYVCGDDPKDVMWTVVNSDESNNRITLYDEQMELLDMIEEYWWYIVGDEE